MRRLEDGRIIVKTLCEIFQLPFFSSSLLHMQLCCSDFYPTIFVGMNLRKNSCQGRRLYRFADIVWKTQTLQILFILFKLEGKKYKRREMADRVP
jgi:hypothetical protein